MLFICRACTLYSTLLERCPRCGGTMVQDVEVPKGIYVHFKGKQYRVLHVAKHSETQEDLVIYEALYGDPPRGIWARPKGMFLEEVVVDGKMTPRFRLLSRDPVS